MFREITKDLLQRKDKPRRKPLLVTGVRLCGKTYIIEKFAQEQFKNYVRRSFEESEKYAAIFIFVSFTF